MRWLTGGSCPLNQTLTFYGVGYLGTIAWVTFSVKIALGITALTAAIFDAIGIVTIVTIANITIMTGSIEVWYCSSDGLNVAFLVNYRCRRRQSI